MQQRMELATVEDGEDGVAGNAGEFSTFQFKSVHFTIKYILFFKLSMS